jgi:hypothetical protein
MLSNIQYKHQSHASLDSLKTRKLAKSQSSRIGNTKFDRHEITGSEHFCVWTVEKQL